MEEIIYRVYMEMWRGSFDTKVQYLAALQGGKDLKLLRHRVNNDTLEGLAADMAREIFEFHCVSRDEFREVCFAFDLPYTFKVSSGGEIKEPHRLHETQEKEFSDRFEETYRQKRRQWRDQEVETTRGKKVG